MATKAEVREAIKYVLSLRNQMAMGQALDIIYNHLDDRGDELVRKRKLHEVGERETEITVAQARIDELQAP